ncbi:LytTR family DNA-binding domain-containing protein [Pseudoflavonifractor phocaeensis]|uniref:LytTR family DNA-binding domain-containing protein n=1 Tax=Pseudoflavonifractor phocaeensis TaxID=1870988 RepID=UPI00195ABCF1|nr:LytTR family DNA-binding domain-containing protein [Pseudoflavonifractor phocaeensis]MBM6871039.1 LytTR family transcriptional regulator [Pseudoflavonifractor phocaeensis]
MKVEIRIVPDRKEPAVVIEAAERTAEVEALAKALSGRPGGLLTGRQGERAVFFPPEEVLRFYGEQKLVKAQTGTGVWTVDQRLYELEEQLDRHTFVRISHSEIVNLRKVTGLDLSLTGTICMTLEGGTTVYVSRRYVKKIKEALDL